MSINKLNLNFEKILNDSDSNSDSDSYSDSDSDSNSNSDSDSDSNSNSDSNNKCNYLNENYKNTCSKFDVFKDSCRQNSYNYYNRFSTSNLIDLLIELKLKKRYFKKCYEERIIFSKKCINNTYDYGHKKVIVLNKKAEDKCNHEVDIINKILRFE